MIDYYDQTYVLHIALTMLDDYWRSIKQIVLLQIDINENMIKSYVGFRVSTLNFYDQMMNSNIFDFKQMLTKFKYLEDRE